VRRRETVRDSAHAWVACLYSTTSTRTIEMKKWLHAAEAAGAIGLMGTLIVQCRRGFDETGVVLLIVFLAITVGADWLRQMGD